MSALAAAAPAAPSAWSPLKNPLFRFVCWRRSSRTSATWMQDVGAGLAHDVPRNGAAHGGASKDRDHAPCRALVCRRANSLTRRSAAVPDRCADLDAVVSAALGCLPRRADRPWVLLAFTCALGRTALMMPAWAATTPESCRRRASGCIGSQHWHQRLSRRRPAIAGVIVSLAGSGRCSAQRGVYLGVIAVLVIGGVSAGGKLRRNVRRRFSCGLRYAWHARAQGVLVRSAAFSRSPPQRGRSSLDRKAGARRGASLRRADGVHRAGAVSGAFFLPRLRARYSRHQLVRQPRSLRVCGPGACTTLRDVYTAAAAMLATGAA